MYGSITLQIINECCGDKFVVRTKNLSKTGFHIEVERIENTGEAGWYSTLSSFTPLYSIIHLTQSLLCIYALCS
jgi:hypothetical protein